MKPTWKVTALETDLVARIKAIRDQAPRAGIRIISATGDFLGTLLPPGESTQPLHPGAWIKERMEAAGHSEFFIATALKIPVSWLSDFLIGEQHIEYGSGYGTRLAEYFKMQRKYARRVAR